MSDWRALRQSLCDSESRVVPAATVKASTKSKVDSYDRTSLAAICNGCKSSLILDGIAARHHGIQIGRHEPHIESL